MTSLANLFFNKGKRKGVRKGGKGSKKGKEKGKERVKSTLPGRGHESAYEMS